MGHQTNQNSQDRKGMIKLKSLVEAEEPVDEGKEPALLAYW